MEVQKLLPNSNLKALMGKWDITITDVSKWINKSVVATSKKIEHQTFTQHEMKLIVQQFQVWEKVDMNIFA